MLNMPRRYNEKVRVAIMSGIEFPDAGELESWRAAADKLLQERRRITDSDLRCAAHKLQNAYLFVTALIKSQEPGPNPLPGSHIPRTCAGFMGATIGTTAHHPTPQQIWDAAIRSWIDLCGDARLMTTPAKVRAKIASDLRNSAFLHCDVNKEHVIACIESGKTLLETLGPPVFKEIEVSPSEPCVLTLVGAHIDGTPVDPRTPIPCTVCQGECGFWRDLSSTNDTWVACAACGGTGSV
jgi:hypothetical protein